MVQDSLWFNRPQFKSWPSLKRSKIIVRWVGSFALGDRTLCFGVSGQVVQPLKNKFMVTYWARSRWHWDAWWWRQREPPQTTALALSGALCQPGSSSLERPDVLRGWWLDGWAGGPRRPSAAETSLSAFAEQSRQTAACCRQSRSGKCGRASLMDAASDEPCFIVFSYVSLYLIYKVFYGMISSLQIHF